MPAVTATFGLCVAAVSLAWCAAQPIADGIKKLGHMPVKTGFLFGKALAFFPIHALTWSFIGLWIGQWGYPLWSLMPTAERLANLAMAEQAARHLWTWAPALFLLMLPLFGQWLSLRLRDSTTEPSTPAEHGNSERNVSTPHLVSPQRGDGKNYAPLVVSRRTRIALPPAMRRAADRAFRHRPSNPLWNTGCFALPMALISEDALGLHGCAALLMQSARAQDPAGAATALLMLSTVAAAGTLLTGSPAFSLPHSFRDCLSSLLKTAAWGLWALALFPDLLPPRFRVDTDLAFSQPATALWVGLAPMLCALSLWLLGHIIAPSKRHL